MTITKSKPSERLGRNENPMSRDPKRSGLSATRRPDRSGLPAACLNSSANPSGLPAIHNTGSAGCPQVTRQPKTVSQSGWAKETPEALCKDTDASFPDARSSSSLSTACRWTASSRHSERRSRSTCLHVRERPSRWCVVARGSRGCTLELPRQTTTVFTERGPAETSKPLSQPIALRP